MTQAHTKQKFQALLDTSHALLAEAEQGNWDELRELEREHRRLLQDFFSSPTIVSDIGSQELATGIRAMLDINDLLVASVTRHQETLKQERLQTGHAHKAAVSYLSSY